MRVFLLQRAEPTPHDGEGAQRLWRTGLMADFFRKAGHQVTWFTSTFDHYGRRQRFSSSQAVEVAPGYTIHYLHAQGYRRNVSYARLKHERELARAFRRQADAAERPDLIICSLPSVEMAAAAADFAEEREIPLVCDVRDLWPDVFLDLLPRVWRRMADPFLSGMRRKLGRAVTQSAAVTGLSDEYIDWALAYSDRPRGPRDAPLPMAYMPTESGRFDGETAAALERKFACNNGELEVLFVGAIGPMMNIEPVIGSARKLQERGAPVRIRICGSGTDLPRLRQMAAGLDNLEFPGWINAEEIRFLLERSHVGLLPYADLDSFRWSIPNKFGEYLAGSLALLCNLPDSAMARTITDWGAGQVYRDSDTLAQILLDLAESPGQLDSLRKSAAMLYKDRFHGPTVFAGFVKDMEDLAATRNG